MGSASASAVCTSAVVAPSRSGLTGEVAADLVGVQVGLGEQIAHARRRERPAVDGKPDEGLQQSQRGRRLAADRAFDPAERAGHRVDPREGKRLRDLEVGVDARMSGGRP